MRIKRKCFHTVLDQDFVLGSLAGGRSTRFVKIGPTGDESRRIIGRLGRGFMIVNLGNFSCSGLAASA